MRQMLYQAEILINQAPTRLSHWQDQSLLLVNTATACGFAPQFSTLEQLHQRYGQSGLKVIGFPCNQFRQQEPISDEAMGPVCQHNFGVTFDLSQRIQVNGRYGHDIFKALKQMAPGILGTRAIKWNFTKFLISPNAKQVRRYAPWTDPLQLEQDIEQLLSTQLSL